ncbi:nicotinamidase-like [Oppia nitens]|uniref:nicotinamidase-like n=1 Tax=Oppia nitens TaxID=1686743 RepID=UPI0023DC1448|nr:nicotinamidase-like [Oppia nitens]
MIKQSFDNFSDTNAKGLTRKSFDNLLSALLVNEDNKPYHIPIQWKTHLFNLFDTNGDDIIDNQEFQQMWNNWIHTILEPTSALIVVDVQNDFISGSLAINKCEAGQQGEEVIPVINQLLDTIPFNKVFYSQDWHPSDHISFYENRTLRKFSSIEGKCPSNVNLYDTVVFEGPPQTRQKLWPNHCIQQTWGSLLHSQLKIVDNSVFIYKGTQSHIDSYSVFWDNQRLSQTNLDQQLQGLGVSDVYVCGIATDICVGYTAVDSCQLGYRTVLIDDGCRGVSDTAINQTKQQLDRNLAVCVHSNQVYHLVTGSDRRPELAYKMAIKQLDH